MVKHSTTRTILDTDFPMFRLAEIYLTRAEAKFCLGDVNKVGNDGELWMTSSMFRTVPIVLHWNNCR